MTAFLLTQALVVLMAPPILPGIGPNDVDAPSGSNFNFDTTEIQTPPPAGIPADALWPEDFSLAMVQAALLETSVPGQPVETFRHRTLYDFPEWELEIDPLAGDILAVRKPRVVDPLPIDENQLRADAMRRLGNWGVAPAEVLRVMQRRLLAQHDDGQKVGPPELARYKTFVIRGINRVPIEGHRAVLTYHLDGRFQRALISWPALARDGHKLMTDLDETAIVDRAERILLRNGEVQGDVTLRWKYIPEETATGEVTLKLMVGAYLPPEVHDEYVEESRVINIPVAAY